MHYGQNMLSECHPKIFHSINYPLSSLWLQLLKNEFHFCNGDKMASKPYLTLFQQIYTCLPIVQCTVWFGGWGRPWSAFAKCGWVISVRHPPYLKKKLFLNIYLVKGSKKIKKENCTAGNVGCTAQNVGCMHVMSAATCSMFVKDQREGLMCPPGSQGAAPTPIHEKNFSVQK